MPRRYPLDGYPKSPSHWLSSAAACEEHCNELQICKYMASLCKPNNSRKSNIARSPVWWNKRCCFNWLLLFFALDSNVWWLPPILRTWLFAIYNRSDFFRTDLSIRKYWLINSQSRTINKLEPLILALFNGQSACSATSQAIRLKEILALVLQSTFEFAN